MTTADHAAVRAYVAAVRAGATVTGVERFASGERHRVFVATFVDAGGVGGQVVVRVSLDDSEAERSQASHEAAVLAAVGGTVGPTLLDVRLENPWFDTPVLCLEHIGGEVRDLAAASARELEALGRLVGDVHAMPTDAVADPGAQAPADVVAYARGWTGGIVARLIVLEEHLPRPVRDEARSARLDAEDRMASVADAPGFARGALALLHADLSPENVLWRPEPLLIDWEYARLGDPADEIGYVFGQHGLDPSQRDAFWRGYGTARSVEGIGDRVRWWEPMGLLGSATWWLERWRERTEADAQGVDHPSAPKASAYYLDHALRRLRRSRQLLDGG